MKFSSRLVVMFLVLCSSAWASGTTQELATQDTRLTMTAEAAGPRVLSVGIPRGRGWENLESEKLIGKVQIDGNWVPIRWKLQSGSSQSGGRTVTFVYTSSEPRLRLRWVWQARADRGPLEHRIEIENLENRVVGFPFQSTLSLNMEVPASQPLEQMWVEKGADTPSAEGTHTIPLGNPYHWEGTSSTYAHPRPGQPREPIPWALVESTDAERAGWYVGIEFSGRTRLAISREGTSLKCEAGLNPAPGPYLTRVPAGGRFVTPTVFLGAFAGGSDAAGNILRRWVSQVLLNPATLHNPAYPLLVNNSWGNGMEINEGKARGMAEDSAKLGLEMFHVDAGWFRGVADWYPHPAKFPHGIAALADYVHGLGLKFGLWVDWTQAGTDTEPGALNVHDPKIRDWLTRDLDPDWKPEPFKGVTIDIGDPPAREWCARELHRLVGDYHLDMLEHDGYLVAEGCVRGDHPHASCAGAPLGPPPFLEGPCSTDVSYHATLAYYALYEQLRRDFPGLLLEACNDGGRMVDFGTAAHVDYFSITDTYDPLSNRRAFYDTSHVLPAAMLECYVERYRTPRLANFLYMLRSGMMGWCTIMQDTTAWSPEEHAAARQAFELYKTRLRPLIRNADLYHISPRPDGVHWDGVEYFAPETGQGVIYVFRGSTPDEDRHTFRLQGLRAERHYRLHFEDHPAQDRTLSGKALGDSGLTVALPLPESSELVFIEEVWP